MKTSVAAALLAGVVSLLPAQSRITPAMVGEGRVSTELNEFGGALAPDGASIYFSISVPRSYAYAICVSHLVNGTWSQPEVLPWSGISRDFDPVMSPDGRRLLFVSDRDERGVTADRPNLDLWVVERKGDSQWTSPRRLPPGINTSAMEWFASEASDGTLYYAASRAGGDLFWTAPVNDGYGPSQPVGPPIDTSGLEGEPVIAPDKSFLLFAAYERAGGFGDWDIYISHRQANGWSEPRNLGPDVNTPSRDYSPRLAPDGHTLFFTSERHVTLPRVGPLGFAALTAALRGVNNGNGNVYTIDLRALGVLTTRAGNTPDPG